VLAHLGRAVRLHGDRLHVRRHPKLN
jgi:hypothetical protein